MFRVSQTLGAALVAHPPQELLSVSWNFKKNLAVITLPTAWRASASLTVVHHQPDPSDTSETE